jgi:hypothetical protein
MVESAGVGKGPSFRARLQGVQFTTKNGMKAFLIGWINNQETKQPRLWATHKQFGGEAADARISQGRRSLNAYGQIPMQNAKFKNQEQDSYRRQKRAKRQKLPGFVPSRPGLSRLVPPCPALSRVRFFLGRCGTVNFGLPISNCGMARAAKQAPLSGGRRRLEAELSVGKGGAAGQIRRITADNDAFRRITTHNIFFVL